MKTSRHFLLLGLILFSAHTLAQTLPHSPNAIKNGKRSGKWTIWMDKDWQPTKNKDSVAYYRQIAYADGKPTGTVADYFRNGHIQWKGNLISDDPVDVMTGTAVWYHESGKKEREDFFDDGMKRSTTIFKDDGSVDEWRSALGTGNILTDQGEYEKAIEFYQKGVNLAKSEVGERHANYAASVDKLAIAYYSLAQFEKAEELLSQNLQLRKDLSGEVDADYIATLQTLASVHRDAGNYAKAEELFLNALELTKATAGDQSEAFALSLNELAMVYNATGSYEKAEPHYQQALKVFRNIKGEVSMDYAGTLTNLALMQVEVGEYEKAEAGYLRAIEIFKELKADRSPDYPVVLDNLASLYRETGEFEKAEPLFIEALQLEKEIIGEDHPNYTTTLMNMATFYQDMGRLEKAEPLLVKVVELDRRQLGETHPYYATSMHNLASVYLEMQQFAKAEQLFLRVLEIDKINLGENHPDLSQTLGMLASLYGEMGQMEKSEQFHIATLNIDKQLGESHPLYAAAVHNLGVHYAMKGEYPAAEPLLLEGLKLRKNIYGNNNPILSTSYSSLNLVYYVTGQYQKSEQYGQALAENILWQVDTFFPSLSEAEKEMFYRKNSKFIELLKGFTAGSHAQSALAGGHLYDLQMDTKALLLNSYLKWKKRIRTSHDSTALALYEELLEKQSSIANLYNSADNSKRQKLDTLLTEANALEKALSERSTLFAVPGSNKHYKWTDVRAALKPKEAAIELIRFKKLGTAMVIVDSSSTTLKKYPVFGRTDTVHYAAVIVTAASNQPTIVLLENGNELEKRGLHFYRNSIASRTADDKSYNLFWQPVAAALGKNVKRVYLSPDGVYNSINLNTLKNPGTQKYLLEEIDLQLVTNTKDLIDQKRVGDMNNHAFLFGYPDYDLTPEKRATLVEKQQHEAPVLAFAPSLERGSGLGTLPGTEIEVESISAILTRKGWKAEVLTGEKALEETVKNCSNPGVLHIATHGFFQPDSVSAKTNPLLQSGLMLAGAAATLDGNKNDEATDDGILTAYEAMNLSLDETDLIVLSACETGLGEIRNGEGVYGLQRAFKVAGARCTVMSLWKVNDESTQELLTSFYSYWVQSGNKREAFKKAQLGLKAKNPSPYHWGAFVMVGN